MNKCESRPQRFSPLTARVGGEVSRDLNARGICLPSSSSLSAEAQALVVTCVRHAVDAALEKDVASYA